jgi:flagellar basal body rod protein FlgB
MSDNDGFIDITNDGGVKKKIISEGNGERPIKNNQVTIRFKEYEEKTPEDELSLKKPITAILKMGNNRIIRGVDIGIQTMKVGEKSKFKISREYLNTIYRNNKFNNINTIIFEIELLKCEKNQRNHSLYSRVYKKEQNQIKNNKEEYKYNIKIINKQYDNVNKIIGIQYKNNNPKINETSKRLEKVKQNDITKRIKYKYGVNTHNEIKLKTYSLICDKCFRLVYISFDFIEHFISTKCPYCYKFDIYKYDTFIEKLKKNNNPLLNCYCKK